MSMSLIRVAGVKDVLVAFSGAVEGEREERRSHKYFVEAPEGTPFPQILTGQEGTVTQKRFPK